MQKIHLKLNLNYLFIYQVQEKEFFDQKRKRF